MKTLLTTAILLLFALTITAQTTCLFDEHAYPQWQTINGTNHPVQDRSVKVLPVVVHVLYEYEFFDIPVSEIQYLIGQVSKNFRRQNADSIDTPDAFKPVAADMGIEFALVSIAPDGSPTSGVTHTQTNSLSIPNIFETNFMKFDSTEGNRHGTLNTM
ncbi:MAG: hypothetical protein IPM82_17195 [Saprospiraceae bacterium]|nr:hypothetical protein [Saprospiraceae bacterium]